jgi:hypothetical protein
MCFSVAQPPSVNVLRMKQLIHLLLSNFNPYAIYWISMWIGKGMHGSWSRKRFLRYLKKDSSHLWPYCLGCHTLSQILLHPNCLWTWLWPEENPIPLFCQHWTSAAGDAIAVPSWYLTLCLWVTKEVKCCGFNVVSKVGTLIHQCGSRA